MIITEDEELNKLMSEISDILQPEPFERLVSHLTSIHIRVEQLRESRDKLKIKYDSLKEKFKNLTLTQK
jgi:predicted transcriptional regulator